MLIREVLAIHDSFAAEGSHSDILGDAFLVENNPVYRNIKSFALGIGAKFSEAQPEYLLMPFHALGEIVASKSVPFIPSARLLRGVEKKRAGALSISDLSIPESYHLHEAAHVIAEHLFAGAALKSAQEKILKAIVCESFANTVDAMACGAVDSDEHAFFLKQNCYMDPNGKYASVMVRLMKSAGLRFTFLCTLSCYIHANFLKAKVPARVFKELGALYAPGLKFSPKVLKDCEALWKMADKLDPLFRVQTTQMYLRLEGFDGEVDDLLDFPFMEVFEANPVFRRVSEAMADVVLGSE